MGRKNGRSRNLQFLDDAHLRVMLDVKKGDAKAHASTFEGKASFMRPRTGMCRDEVYAKMQIANFYQDSFLNSSISPDPKYMPGFMGGTNNPSLFGKKYNLYLYMHSWKNGTYQRLYGSAVQEAIDAVRHYDMTDTPTNLYLCPALRVKAEYLMATYDDKIAVPGKSLLPTVLDKPLYKALSQGSGALGAESQMVRNKQLVSRSLAEIEYTRYRRDSQIIFGGTTVTTMEVEDREKKKAVSAKWGDALRASSAFQNLINRTANPDDMGQLMQEGFTVLNRLMRRFTREHTEFIFRNLEGAVYSIRDLRLTEDMFLLEDVSSRINMKVSGIELNFIGNKGQYKTKVTDSQKVGLWQVNETQAQWASETTKRLKEFRTYYDGLIPLYRVTDLYLENRIWTADDSPLLQVVRQDCIRYGWGSNDCIAILTEDKKLSFQMADFNHITVIRVNMTWFLNRVHRMGWEFKAELDLSYFLSRWGAEMAVHIDGMSRHPKNLYMDNGAFETFAVFLERLDNRSVKGTFTSVHSKRSGKDPQGKRYEVVEVHVMDSQNNMKWTDGYESIIRPQEHSTRKIRGPGSTSSYGSSERSRKSGSTLSF